MDHFPAASASPSISRHDFVVSVWCEPVQALMAHAQCGRLRAEGLAGPRLVMRSSTSRLSGSGVDSATCGMCARMESSGVPC